MDMKILIALLLAAAPLSAGNWENAPALASGLLAGRAEIETIGGAPLLDLLASRDLVCQPLEIGGVKFLATVVFDDNWDTWFLLKPASGLGAGAWKETSLANGAVYRYGGLELHLKAEKGVVRIDRGAEESKEISINALFDKLYADSMKVTFGGIITYAVFRNLEPLSEEEGTVTLRLGSDGLYYYSVTRDSLVSAAPRWLLAVNGVLYGLRVQAGSLLFVSKKLDLSKPALPAERARAR
jgi:hypothetical protein